jgi:hypothetical protein
LIWPALANRAFSPAIRLSSSDAGSSFGSCGYNLDIKNPHTVAADHGDPEELLAGLNTVEAETAALRNQLKAILAEALAQ